AVAEAASAEAAAVAAAIAAPAEGTAAAETAPGESAPAEGAGDELLRLEIFLISRPLLRHKLVGALLDVGLGRRGASFVALRLGFGEDGAGQHNGPGRLGKTTEERR